ncbi:hypothetical protein J6590_074682 [Homalodisca vitripennis]|nr:hypothetical protein J6590_074682 [Homalodisca vitripennis]
MQENAFMQPYASLYCGTFIKDVNYQLKTSSILQDNNPETACRIQVTSDWNLSPQGSRRFGLRRYPSTPR